MPKPGQVKQKALKAKVSDCVWERVARDAFVSRMQYNLGGVASSSATTSRSTEHDARGCIQRDVSDVDERFLTSLIRKACRNPGRNGSNAPQFSEPFLGLCGRAKADAAQACTSADVFLRSQVQVPSRHTFVDLPSSSGEPLSEAGARRRARSEGPSLEPLARGRWDWIAPFLQLFESRRVLHAIEQVLGSWRQAECARELDINTISPDAPGVVGAVSRGDAARAIERLETAASFEHRVEQELQTSSSNELQRIMHIIADELCDVALHILDMSSLPLQERDELKVALRHGFEDLYHGRLSGSSSLAWESFHAIFTHKSLINLHPYWNVLQQLLVFFKRRQIHVVMSANEESCEQLSTWLEQHHIPSQVITPVSKIADAIRDRDKAVIWYLYGHMEGRFCMLERADGSFYTCDDIPTLIEMVKPHVGNLQMVFVNGCGGSDNGCGGSDLGKSLHKAGVPWVIYWEDRPLPTVAEQLALKFFEAFIDERLSEDEAFRTAKCRMTQHALFGTSPDDKACVGATSGTLAGTDILAGGNPQILAPRKVRSPRPTPLATCKCMFPRTYIFIVFVSVVVMVWYRGNPFSNDHESSRAALTKRPAAIFDYGGVHRQSCKECAKLFREDRLVPRFYQLMASLIKGDSMAASIILPSMGGFDPGVTTFLRCEKILNGCWPPSNKTLAGKIQDAPELEGPYYTYNGEFFVSPETESTTPLAFRYNPASCSWQWTAHCDEFWWADVTIVEAPAGAWKGERPAPHNIGLIEKLKAAVAVPPGAPADACHEDL